MDIDLARAECSIDGFAVKPLDGAVGELKAGSLRFGVVFRTTPYFLDTYLAGHLTGAQPSAVFWRQLPDSDKLYNRYPSIAKLVLAVAKSRKYIVDIEVDAPGDVESPWKLSFQKCELTSIEVAMTIDNAVVHAKFKTETREPSEVSTLSRIAQYNKLLVSIRAEQVDMVEQIDQHENSTDGKPDADLDWPQGEGDATEDGADMSVE
jgi:hypothetical protein